MIIWKSILNEYGRIVAPYNTLLALRVGWNDEKLGDLHYIYPVEIIMEDEQDEPGGKLHRYPMVLSICYGEDILPEDLGSHHKWCLWSDYTRMEGACQ